MQFKQRNDDHHRYCGKNIRDPLHDKIGFTSVITRNRSVYRAYYHIDDGDGYCEKEGEPRARSKACQNIFPLFFASEQEIRRFDTVLIYISVTINIILVIVDPYLVSRACDIAVTVKICFPVTLETGLTLYTLLGSISVVDSSCFVLPVNGDNFTFLVKNDLSFAAAPYLRFEIIVRVFSILIFGTILRVDGRIDHLFSGLILIFLDIGKFLG